MILIDVGALLMILIGSHLRKSTLKRVSIINSSLILLFVISDCLEEFNGHGLSIYTINKKCNGLNLLMLRTKIYNKQWKYRKKSIQWKYMHLNYIIPECTENHYWILPLHNFHKYIFRQIESPNLLIIIPMPSYITY